MKPIFSLLFCTIFLLASCEEEKQQLICSEQYESISIKLKDLQNEPIALESFKVTRSADQTDMTVKVDPTISADGCHVKLISGERDVVIK